MTEPEAKWIVFRDLGPSPSGKTRRFAVVARRDSAILGEIGWFRGWRRYVFAPSPDTEFEAECLRDIAAFCDRSTNEAREAMKARS